MSESIAPACGGCGAFGPVCSDIPLAASGQRCLACTHEAACHKAVEPELPEDSYENLIADVMSALEVARLEGHRGIHYRPGSIGVGGPYDPATCPEGSCPLLREAYARYHQRLEALRAKG